ncbi:MAG TPA: hypothetical protein VF774_09190, partial [Pseudoduganella sp.]
MFALHVIMPSSTLFIILQFFRLNNQLKDHPMHYAGSLRRLPLVIAIGAVLALAGCGGSDDDNRVDTVVSIPAAPADQG